MRVLLVNDLPPGPTGGAEVYVGRLAGGLGAAGDSVEVFTAGRPRAGARRAFDVWDPAARRRLRELARRFQPQVIHYHNVLRELSVSVLGAVPGAPSLLTVHDLRLLGAPDPDTRVRRLAKAAKTRVDRRVARGAVDVAVGASPPVADRLRAAGFPHVAQVPVFAPPPPAAMPVAPVAGCRQIAYVGRLDDDKGVMALAGAFRRLLGRDGAADARLVLVGDGARRADLDALSRELGRHRIELTGQLDEVGVREVMASSRVVVRPSLPARRPEGASLTVVEAALVGRPVVVTDDPANRELVDACGCGIVVPSASPDLAGALADALHRVLADDGLATSMGDAGRAYALRNHTVAAATQRYRAIYRELLAR